MRRIFNSTILGVALMVTYTAPRATGAGPDVLVGTWTWTWKDGEGKTHKHVLDVESAAGKLTARERFDDQDSIKVDDLRVTASDVFLSVKRGDRMSEYKGRLAGTKTINGVVNVVVNGQAQEFQ